MWKKSEGGNWLNVRIICFSKLANLAADATTMDEEDFAWGNSESEDESQSIPMESISDVQSSVAEVVEELMQSSEPADEHPLSPKDRRDMRDYPDGRVDDFSAPRMDPSERAEPEPSAKPAKKPTTKDVKRAIAEAETQEEEWEWEAELDVKTESKPKDKKSKGQPSVELDFDDVLVEVEKLVVK